MAKEKTDNKNLGENLRKLSEISKWFDGREEIDVEQGLEKVKEAAILIKASRERLKEVENEFEEIKKEIEGEDLENSNEEKPSKDINIKDVPF